MNFFYFDQVNRKQGPVSKEQLQELVARGVIGPNTPMETDGGHKGVAGQISGLFSATSPPPVQPIPVPHGSPPPVSLFCTNCGKSVSEKAVACMACGAKPIGHKKFCRQCGNATNPEQVVCVKCGASLTGGNFGAGASAMANTTMANLKSALQATRATFTSSSCVGRATTNTGVAPIQHVANVPHHHSSKARVHFWTVLCIVSSVIYLAMLSGWMVQVFELVSPGMTQSLLEQAENDDLSAMEIVVGSMFYIAGGFYLFCYYFYLRRLWEEIHPAFARTTPEKAALFMLIPFFNWYWQFIAFLGLYDGMNKAMESYGLDTRFERSWIEITCFGWLVISIVGVVYGFYVHMSPDGLDWLTTGSEFLDSSILFLVNIVSMIVTALVYWLIRKDMLEFIDIKSSKEQ